ncbi:hypothetical protein H7J07_09430 [Mycobacterium koreense]|uniref:Uncharacterized protein n=1 Tax=Mycolicibacillus koreensis TaxID=1069220 RepID=A0A7I7SEN4_9MYCO|nr:hypothetical protein [Mycolicibacillus koreensis]MCV7248438.1 hypothetical protein [Mycolicibacillus koreensis]ODR11703.1 hypothetical protein BHQ15_00445 [Mycolicibacillus koreensis]OSC26937.1 hypothetical protein B8W67_18210 [Mycolicibacillus koreensis]BBY55382.1 hypothetical protein MKOR_26330 [Mycolicibacillus koreensis]
MPLTAGAGRLRLPLAALLVACGAGGGAWLVHTTGHHSDCDRVQQFAERWTATQHYIIDSVEADESTLPPDFTDEADALLDENDAARLRSLADTVRTPGMAEALRTWSDGAALTAEFHRDVATAPETDDGWPPAPILDKARRAQRLISEGWGSLESLCPDLEALRDFD